MKNSKELKGLKRKEKLEGLILGISGIIIFIDFSAIDASIFNTTAPPMITQMANMFTLSPLLIDIITTIALITIISMLGTQRKLGRYE